MAEQNKRTTIEAVPIINEGEKEIISTVEMTCISHKNEPGSNFAGSVKFLD
jgi:hypothetical protein